MKIIIIHSYNTSKKPVTKKKYKKKLLNSNTKPCSKSTLFPAINFVYVLSWSLIHPLFDCCVLHLMYIFFQLTPIWRVFFLDISLWFEGFFVIYGERCLYKSFSYLLFLEWKFCFKELLGSVIFMANYFYFFIFFIWMKRLCYKFYCSLRKIYISLICCFLKHYKFNYQFWRWDYVL